MGSTGRGWFIAIRSECCPFKEWKQATKPSESYAVIPLCGVQFGRGVAIKCSQKNCIKERKE